MQLNQLYSFNSWLVLSDICSDVQVFEKKNVLYWLCGMCCFNKQWYWIKKVLSDVLSFGSCGNALMCVWLKTTTIMQAVSECKRDKCYCSEPAFTLLLFFSRWRHSLWISTFSWRSQSILDKILFDNFDVIFLKNGLMWADFKCFRITAVFFSLKTSALDLHFFCHFSLKVCRFYHLWKVYKTPVADFYLMIRF